MITFAARELWVRRGITFLALLGLLSAVVGFSLVGLAARRTAATLEGDLTRAWNTPYDLLVRPAGSVSELERTQGLVRPNFSSGINGGITRQQLSAIRAIAGVAVAAPIASVGFVLWPSALQVPIPSSGAAMYRVRANETADAGLSHLPIEERYIVVARDGTMDLQTGVLRIGDRQITCRYPINCFAGIVCRDTCERDSFPSSEGATYYLPVLEPIVIAGVDPAAEAALAGLDHCVRSGSYLHGTEPLINSGEFGERQTALPVLVSTSPFIDETVDVSIERALDASWLTGPVETVREWAPVSDATHTTRELYDDYLASVHDYMDVWPLWSVGAVHYASGGSADVTALPVGGDPSVYQKMATSEFGIPGSLLPPPEARDLGFRQVVLHNDRYRTADGVPLDAYRAKAWNVVGTYDPTCIPGFDPLAGGGLETYSYPRAALPDGSVLEPTRSMAGYINSPPLLLTTLDGAEWLSDPARYDGQPGKAFISLIRVKVEGVDQPGDTSVTTLARVASDIRDATGLAVDVVKGASPRNVTVALPPGAFGRPALTIVEPWSLKGVVIRFAHAVDSQTVSLGAIALVGATVLVGETAIATVRRRRQEFATLRALGWSGLRIAVLVELEALLLGLVTGVLGSLVSFGTSVVLAVDASPLQLIAPLPLALGLALGASIWPAWSATLGNTASRLRGPLPWGVRARASRSITLLAARDLASRSLVEIGLGTLALALGFAILGAIVTVALGFRGALDSTVLGTHLAARVEGFHLILGAIALATGSFAAGQIVALGYLERGTELAALRAIGWPARTVARFIATQAAIVIALGSLVGAGTLAIGAALVHAPTESYAIAISLCVILSALVAGIALLVPLRSVYRLDPTFSLREE